MKRISKPFGTTCLLWLVVATPWALAQSSLEFDSLIFDQRWSGSDGSTTSIEFVPVGETLEAWGRMLTIQCHPEASELKDVIAPYFEKRKALVAMRPEVSENSQGHRQDSNLILFLGAPGKTDHIEFVIARFVGSDDQTGVYAIIYSHKFPASRNVDVSVAMENKDSWIKELSTVPLESLVASCNEKRVEMKNDDP